MTKPISLGFLVGSTYKPLIKTLSLNFLAGTTLDSRVTFSRASNATLVDSTGKLTYAPNNLVLRSEELDNASWTKTSGIVIPTSETTAPDGTLTAFKHIPNAGVIMGSGANETRVYQDVAAVIGVKYIYSMYAKAAEYDQIQFSIIATPSASVTFSLTLGTIIGGGVASITPVGNGWYRCSFSLPAGVTTVQVRFSAEDSTALDNKGNGTSGIYVWGAQFERVTYQTVPSAYNRTVASAYHGPRFDFDPVTLAPDGLLIEEQRVNLAFRSQDFTDAAWIPARATSTADVTTSPDGTTNADRITADGTSGNHNISQNVTYTAAAHTISVYAKKDTNDFMQLRFATAAIADGTGFANFDLNAGTVGTIGAGLSAASITPAGNGWYRCTISGTTLAGATNFAIYIVTNASATSAQSNTLATSIFLYGAQLEVGSFSTSFIPTGSAQATRIADNVSMTGTNFSSWYNQSEGTFVASYINPIVGPNRFPAVYAARIQANNSSQNTNEVFLATSSSQSLIRISNVDQASNSFTGAYTPGTIRTVATTYKVNDFAVASNGVLSGGTDVSGNVPTTLNMLNIGFNTSSDVLNSHIRSISYYPVRWANAQLPSLTI